MITMVACAVLASIGSLTAPAAAGGLGDPVVLIKNGDGLCMTAATFAHDLPNFGSGAVQFIPCHGGASQKWKLSPILNYSAADPNRGVFIQNVWTGWFLRWLGPGQPVALVKEASLIRRDPGKEGWHDAWTVEKKGWIKAGLVGWRPSKQTEVEHLFLTYYCQNRDWVLDSNPKGYASLVQVNGTLISTSVFRPRCGDYPVLGQGSQQLHAVRA